MTSFQNEDKNINYFSNPVPLDDFSKPLSPQKVKESYNSQLSPIKIQTNYEYPPIQNILSPKKEIYTITEYPNLPNFLSKENQNAQIYNNTFSPLKENQNIQKYSYSPSKENPIVQKYGSPSSFKQRLPHLKEINTQNISKQRPMPRIIESRMQNYQIDSKVTNPLETNQENKENEEKNMSETLKEKNMFSKHIFEDKVVLEVLEKNMTGGLSRIPEKSINLENEYQTEGKEGKLVKRMNESDSDPYARMGHMVFKILSLLSYLMLGESTESKNMVYQTIIFLSAIDFWVVKNVTGRFLIGIRYWVEFDGRGKEYWVFETRYDKDIKPNATNGSIFWITQGIFLAIWICAMIYQLISMQLTMTVCLGVAAFSTGLNLLIYRRCNDIKKEKMNDFLAGMSNLDRTIYLVRGSIKLPIFKPKIR